MSYFRSETMSYYQIVVPRESAWDVYNELGKIEAIETVDMTPEEPLLTRPFYPMIKRCDDVLGKLATFETFMLKYRIKNLSTQNIREFLELLPEYSAEQEIPDDRWFETIENNLEERNNQLGEQIKNLETLTTRQNNLFEYKAVLLKSKEVLGSQYYQSGKNAAINPIGGGDEYITSSNKNFSLSYLVGVINKDDSMRFKRIMFRATKGNSWIVMSDIEYSKHDAELQDSLQELDNKTFKQVAEVRNPRSVFIVVYQGGLNDFLKQKLNRICDSFGANKQEMFQYIFDFCYLKIPHC